MNKSLKLQIINPIKGEAHMLPLFSSRVSCGFPSPADDFIEKRLDLNDLVINHQASTFYVRSKGDSMIGASIYPDDILVVDKSVDPKNDSIVVAYINGEFTVKKLVKKSNQILLRPCNTQYEDILITEDMDFSIWGVVTYVVHSLV